MVDEFVIWNKLAWHDFWGLHHGLLFHLVVDVLYCTDLKGCSLVVTASWLYLGRLVTTRMRLGLTWTRVGTAWVLRFGVDGVFSWDARRRDAASLSP